MITKMTPCEELGYVVGDRFHVRTTSPIFEIDAGDTLTLKEDDGSRAPSFINQRTGHTIPCSIGRLVKIPSTIYERLYKTYDNNYLVKSFQADSFYDPVLWTDPEDGYWVEHEPKCVTNSWRKYE